MLQIHKASAGSGKTYSLTREYLRLLLGEKPQGSDRYRLRPRESYGFGKPKHHGSILAITFTNKATEEMTSRIISELYLLSHPQKIKITHSDGTTEEHIKKSPYLKEFMTDFSASEKQLMESADRALKDLLFNFTWFNVSTIDSFFQKVLNTFARELELTPTHSVEISDNRALQVATGKLLNAINANINGEEGKSRRRRLEAWLRRYMTAQLQEGGSFNLLSQNSDVNRKLVSYMGAFFNEDYKLNRELIDPYLEDTERVQKFHQAIMASDYMRGIAPDLTARAKALYPKADGRISRYLLPTIEKLAGGIFPEKFTPSWTKALTDEIARRKSKNEPLDAALDAELTSLMQDVTEFDNTRRFYNLLVRHTFLLGIFGELNHFLEEYRQEHDQLLLSDTGDLLNRIINEEETPFIYERMGTAIQHYLIDEFQDTSKMQWSNISPLLLESMSNESDNLIIGDEKQCIYRFRNSDPSLLGNDVETLVESRFPGYVEPRGTRIAENTNWRSSGEVVRFNNSLFLAMAPLMDNGIPGNPVQATYSGLIQQLPKEHEQMPGYVKITFLPHSSKAGNEPEGNEEENSEEEASVEDMQYRMMMAEIDRQLSAGYRPRDIAILVRYTKQGKELIARMMKTMEDDPQWTHGVLPIMSTDSMSVSLSPAVRMIVSVLRLVTQPVSVKTPDTDGKMTEKMSAAYRRYRLIHRFELCRFDLTEETDENGAPLLNDDGTPRMRRLTPEEALRKALDATAKPLGETGDEIQDRIDHDLMELSRMESPTLIALTESIIARFITPDSREKESAFICAFQDMVLDYSEFGNNDLTGFLKWWDQTGSQTNVAAPEGMDAISVMTIHKSKGLEYKCVHIPYCSFEAVSEHKPKKMNLDWYKIDKTRFPGIDKELIPPFMPIPNLRSNKELQALRSQALVWEAQQKIDNLNLVYVAMTRAVSELCVYCNNSNIIATEAKVEKAKAEGKSQRDIDKTAASLNNTDQWNMADYILSALRGCTAQSQREAVRQRLLPLELQRQQGKDEEPVTAADILRWLEPLANGATQGVDGSEQYIFGAPTAPADDTDSDSRKEVVEETWSVPAATFEPDDPDGIEIPYDSLLESYQVYENNRLTASMKFEDIADFRYDNDRHRGIMLHDVLSRVRHRADLDRALHAAAYRYRLTADQRRECHDQLTSALADPRVIRWFEGFSRVLNERSLTSIFERRRPDRVIWTADGTIEVVDYKFGHINREEYREQVRDYVNLLDFAGHHGAKGYLWFPLTGEIIQVV